MLASICNFRGPFFKDKGIFRLTKSKKNEFFLRFLTSTLCRRAILGHYEQLKKPGLELPLNPGCLSGEIMTQTKRSKAIERVRGYKDLK